MGDNDLDIVAFVADAGAVVARDADSTISEAVIVHGDGVREWDLNLFHIHQTTHIFPVEPATVRTEFYRVEIP